MGEARSNIRACRDITAIASLFARLEDQVYYLDGIIDFLILFYFRDKALSDIK